MKAPALVLVLGLVGQAGAHRLDEYLQSATLSLGGERVGLALEMTPGVEVAARVVREIDRDGDGEFSPAERREYGARLLEDLSLEVDGYDVRLEVESLQFPSIREVKSGEGKIRVEFEGHFEEETSARWLVFVNRHFPDISVYSANCAVNAEFEVSKQERSRDQAQYEVEFSRRRNWDWVPVVLGIVALLLGAWAAKRFRRMPSAS